MTECKRLWTLDTQQSGMDNEPSHGGNPLNIVVETSQKNAKQLAESIGVVVATAGLGHVTENPKLSSNFLGRLPAIGGRMSGPVFAP